MAAFLLDSSSVFTPMRSPIKMLGFLEEPNSIDYSTTPLSQFHQPETLQGINASVGLHESSACFPQGTKVINDTSFISTSKTCTHSSSILTDKVESGSEQVSQNHHQASPPFGKKRKTREGSSSLTTTSAQSKNMKEMKAKKQKRCGEVIKKDEKQGPNSEDAPSGYIHVRARRGQATDSHSLAERVRREKISERMKILQGLVPGCDKVTGKALMLDEIINYVQSLQYQVEFLSMKLASMTYPMFYDFGVDLEALMVTNEQFHRLNDMVSQPQLPPPPGMQPCNPAPPSAPVVVSESNNSSLITTTAAANIYKLLENNNNSSSSAVSSFHQFQQGLLSNNSPARGNGQMLWDSSIEDALSQKLINHHQQFWFTSSMRSHHQ